MMTCLKRLRALVVRLRQPVITQHEIVTEDYRELPPVVAVIPAPESLAPVKEPGIEQAADIKLSALAQKLSNTLKSNPEEDLKDSEIGQAMLDEIAKAPNKLVKGALLEKKMSEWIS